MPGAERVWLFRDVKNRDVFVKRTGTYSQRALNSHTRSDLHRHYKHGTG